MIMCAFPVTFAVLPLLFIISAAFLIRHYRNPLPVGVRTYKQPPKPTLSIWALIIPADGTGLYLDPVPITKIHRYSLSNGITSHYTPDMTSFSRRYRKAGWRGWGVRDSDPVPHMVTGLTDENGVFCEGFGGGYFGFKTLGLDDAAENKTLIGSEIRGDVVVLKGDMLGLEGVVEMPFEDMPDEILLLDNEWVWEGIVATLAKA